MKSQWEKKLEAAVAAYDTPMPWARGKARQAMISRRAAKADTPRAPRQVTTQDAKHVA